VSVRIAITGASGFVGRQLVPRLVERGATLLLIGRDPDALRSQFPGLEAAGYDDIPVRAAGFDLLLHLAVVNNDRDATWDEVLRTNVDLALETYRHATTAAIGRFAFVSSSLALDERDRSDYARSKRLAEERIREEDGIPTTILYFPAVIGDELAGKLAHLNRLPKPLRRTALKLLGSLKPTVDIDKIVQTVVALAGGSAAAPSLIVSDGQRENVIFQAIKRLFDLGFALSILLFMWWAMAIIWLLVRLQSEGPGIFRQIRVGKGKRAFVCYKFRTMLTSTPSVGTHDAPASSVTTLGRILRRTKLDELPQVFNILAGQMSLVGPRPCLPNQLELIEARSARGVFDALPGITGLAQIRGIDMSDPNRLAKCDAQYIALQSFQLDLGIVLRTCLGGGSGDRIVARPPQIGSQ